MGIVTRIGKWLDARFPEKISAEEVYKSLAAYQSLAGEIMALNVRLEALQAKQDAFTTGAQAFEKVQNEFKDELNKAKIVISAMTTMNRKPIMDTSQPWKR